MTHFIDFTNRTILLTGAASGIGRSTAIELSKYNANLILFDKDHEGLKETVSQCFTSKIFYSQVDLTNTERLVDEVIKGINEVGKLDGFAHIAGVPAILPLKATDKEAFELVLSVNTYPVLELAKIFSNKKYRNIPNNSTDSRTTSIVLVSSIYANVGSAANVLYSASKAAIQGITRSLSIELAPKNIRVNCVAPGFIDTKMKNDTNMYFEQNHDDLVSSLHPLGLGRPIDIANSIIFLLSDRANWVTGSIMNVDGGYCAQ